MKLLQANTFAKRFIIAVIYAAIVYGAAVITFFHK